MVSLQPLSGPPRELYAALRDWVAAPTDVPVVVRTSGSTGTPKDVVLSRRAMLASARAALHRLGGPGQWVLPLPAHYVAGAQVLLRSVLAGSAPVLLDEHPDLGAAVAAMEPGVRRYVSLVPTQLTRMLVDDAEALARFDAVLVGGGPMSHDLRLDAADAGVRAVSTYGMSETCGGCVYDGVPLDGVGVRVAADGRIHLLGPVLFDGYAGPAGPAAPVRPDLLTADGALRTPDLGRLDDDGRLVVLGRVDDVVVSGGVNVSLPAVEDCLRGHPAVADVAVVGVDDDEWGSRVVAAVVAPAPPLEELRDHVGSRMPRTWAPRQRLEVDALPMLESGKVDRVALRALAGERGAGDED